MLFDEIGTIEALNFRSCLCDNIWNLSVLSGNRGCTGLKQGAITALMGRGV